MKIFYLTLLLFIASNLQAQNKTLLAPGRYEFSETDSTTDVNWRKETCGDAPILEYFNVRTKYFYSGQTLVEKINKIYKKPLSNLQSGFVTIRFLVNCKGQTGYFKTTETDLNKQAIKLDTAIVSQLQQFVKTLNTFPLATYKNEAANYFYYFTFKIIDNEIKTISP